MGEFTISDKETVVAQLLREQFPLWGARGRTGFPMVMDWAKLILLPLVKEANAAYANMPAYHVSLLVGICNGAKAESGRFCIEQEVKFTDAIYNRSAALYPQNLESWYANRFQKNARDPYGEMITGPQGVAAHAKKIVEEAIAVDKKLTQNNVPQCGGHAEVVIVDSKGAAFVYKAPDLK